ncbi:signal transduction protein [Halobacteriales archaeon QS_8_69_26]|nr:MAG: signal transduction protein [Halobacteriales archaeon QS_8_69_26]
MDSDATVGDVITGEYVGVTESDSVAGTVGLMCDDQSSSAIVLRGSDPVGIVTEWDVLEMVDAGMDPDETAVSEVMSTPVRSIPPDATLVEAAGVMSTENIRNLLVEDDDVVGVLTDRDVIALVASLRPNSVEDPGVGGPTGEEFEAVESDPEGGTTGFRSSAAPAATDAEYSTQGLCEVCGALADTLAERNGQLVCSDCREM